MGFWERFDRILTSFEKKGFNFANKAHVWTINIMLIGIAWGTYTIFRDYNEFFLAGRVKTRYYWLFCAYTDSSYQIEPKLLWARWCCWSRDREQRRRHKCYDREKETKINRQRQSRLSIYCFIWLSACYKSTWIYVFVEWVSMCS